MPTPGDTIRRMLTLTRRTLLLAVAVTSVLGCGVRVTGSPRAVDNDPAAPGPFPTATRSSTVPQTSEPPRPPGPLVNTDPCSLLTPAEVATLKTGPGHIELVGQARACRYKKDYNGGDGLHAGVAIFDYLSLDEVVTYTTPKPVTVGKRRAVQSMRGIRTCAVTLEVTPTSRVDTQGTGQTDEQSCAVALQIARMVEPKLPPP